MILISTAQQRPPRGAQQRASRARASHTCGECQPSIASVGGDGGEQTLAWRGLGRRRRPALATPPRGRRARAPTHAEGFSSALRRAVFAENEWGYDAKAERVIYGPRRAARATAWQVEWSSDS